MSNWTLFSNHGHVLVCLARDPQARLRDVAADVGMTERAVQKIVRDLKQGDIIAISKHGRRNQYEINREMTLRHNLESDSTIGGLLDYVGDGAKKVDKVADRLPKPASVIDEPIKIRSIDPKPRQRENEDEKTVSQATVERQQGSLF